MLGATLQWTSISSRGSSRSRNTLDHRHFMLRKSDIIACLMGHLPGSGILCFGKRREGKHNVWSQVNGPLDCRRLCVHGYFSIIKEHAFCVEFLAERKAFCLDVLFVVSIRKNIFPGKKTTKPSALGYRKALTRPRQQCEFRNLFFVSTISTTTFLRLILVAVGTCATESLVLAVS